MSKKKVFLAPLANVYRTAFEACAALWPIFFIRIIFLFLNLSFLFLSLAVCCWPLLRLLLGHWNNFHNSNFKNMIGEINWMNYFGSLQTLIIAGLFAAFYITCVSFFLAFFDAAVYSELNKYQKKGLIFSWSSFCDGGIRKMIPMVGLQCAWLLVALAGIFTFCFLVFLGVFAGKLLPWWMNVLLAFPAGLAGVLMVIAFAVAAALSGAYLVDGYGIWDSIKESLLKTVEYKGRAMWAVILMGSIYMVFLIAFTVVFSVLAMAPIIGILFTIFKFLVTSVLAIGFNIYMTSLCVTLQLEPKALR